MVVFPSRNARIRLFPGWILLQVWLIPLALTQSAGQVPGNPAPGQPNFAGNDPRIMEAAGPGQTHPGMVNQPVGAPAPGFGNPNPVPNSNIHIQQQGGPGFGSQNARLGSNVPPGEPVNSASNQHPSNPNMAIPVNNFNQAPASLGQQNFNNQPPPSQPNFNNPPPPGQQSFQNQPPPVQPNLNQQLPPVQQNFNNQPPVQPNFNQQPPPVQQNFNNPPPPSQQNFHNQPPPVQPNFNQQPPPVQQNFNNQPPQGVPINQPQAVHQGGAGQVNQGSPQFQGNFQGQPNQPPSGHPPPLHMQRPPDNNIPQPVQPVPSPVDLNMQPHHVPMAQVPHEPGHQPPAPPMHPPPPHAAGVQFDDMKVAAIKRSDSNLKPVPGEHAPDVYNEFRHHHEPVNNRAFDNSRTPRQEVPPDEFVSMTIIVPPGSKNCYFYTPIIDFVVYFQVVHGGAMDIGLRVLDPEGRNVINQRPSVDGKFSITVPSHFRMRSYAVCFDNRKASFDEKRVSMMVDIDVNWDNPSEAEKKAMEFLRKRALGDAHIPAMHREYAESWRAIDERVEGLYGRLHRIKLLQQRSNNFASVDKALMESNLARVSTGSVVQILIMFGVAALQIMLIRAFFDPDSRFYRIWFGKRSVIGARC